jgi:HAD superfamily hydrolase (TIGR01509 family)
MDRIHAVIFDLDGTLINSKHDYREMMRRVSEILKREELPEEMLSRPRKVWQIIRRGMNGLREIGLASGQEKRIFELINSAINEVEMMTIPTVELMPLAQETLKALRKMGLRIGIATRGHGNYARSSLDKVGLSDYIDVLLARDEVIHPKPNAHHLLDVAEALKVPPQNVIYVGDTTTDLTSARNANISFIGFIGREEWAKRMKEGGCETLISELTEILDIIESYNSNFQS